MDHVLKFTFLERLLRIIVWLVEQTYLHQSRRIIFNQIRFNGITITGEIKTMELREGQEFTVSAALETAAGHAAAFQAGTAVWESSDPSVASVEVDPNKELQAVVKGLDGSNNGSALITFSVDGDPDADETRDILGTLDAVCTQGEAVVVELTAGPVSDSGAPTE